MMTPAIIERSILMAGLEGDDDRAKALLTGLTDHDLQQLDDALWWLIVLSGDELQARRRPGPP